MNRKGIALLFAILTALSVFLYCFQKRSTMEAGFAEEVSARNAKQCGVINEMISRGKANPGDLKKYIAACVKSDPSLAMIIFTDTENSLHTVIKDNSLTGSASIFESLYRDYRRKRIRNGTPAVKSYTSMSGEKKKFHLYETSGDGFRMLAVYSPELSGTDMIRIALELILVISLCLVITAIAAVIAGKSSHSAGEESENEPEHTTANGKGVMQEGKSPKTAPDDSGINRQPDENSPGYVVTSRTDISREAVENSGRKKDLVNDSMNTRIFELFKSIHAQFAPRYVSLYIKKMEGKLNKSYELSGSTFLTVDSSVLDCIDISSLEHFTGPGAAVKDSGKLIQVPLMDGQSLIGLLEMGMKKPLKKFGLENLKEPLAGLSEEIRDYIIINSVIKDRHTGFYSAPYLRMKLSEAAHSCRKEGEAFSILAINLFRGININGGRKKKVLKIAGGEIRRLTGNREVFINDSMPVIILQNESKEESEELRDSLVKNLSRFKIKISETDIVKLRPAAALSELSDPEDAEKILENTVSRIS